VVVNKASGSPRSKDGLVFRLPLRLVGWFRRLELGWVASSAITASCCSMLKQRSYVRMEERRGSAHRHTDTVRGRATAQKKAIVVFRH
jgi:hypothetical protein